MPSPTSPRATTLNATGRVLLDLQWAGKTVHTKCGEPSKSRSKLLRNRAYVTDSRLWKPLTCSHEFSGMLADEVAESPLGEDVAGHLGVGIGQRRNAGLGRGGDARSRGSCQLHPVACPAALAGTARRSTAGLVAGPPHRASAASGYRAASATAAVATAEYIHRQSERRMIHPSIRFTAPTSHRFSSRAQFSPFLPSFPPSSTRLFPAQPSRFDITRPLRSFVHAIRESEGKKSQAHIFLPPTLFQLHLSFLFFFSSFLFSSFCGGRKELSPFAPRRAPQARSLDLTCNRENSSTVSGRHRISWKGGSKEDLGVRRPRRGWERRVDPRESLRRRCDQPFRF